MRTKYQLWKVSNGWLLVPEGANSGISPNDAPNCAVFKSLKDFADFKPKRERNRRKPKGGYAVNYTGTQPEPEPQHTKD